MIRKNVSGQHVYFTMVVAATGAADASATVTAYISIDGGAQGSPTGSVTNLGNGQYRFNLSQADTNGNQIGLLLTATSDVPVSITITTTAADLTNSNNLGLAYLTQGPMMVKKNQAMGAFSFPMFDLAGNSKTGLTVACQRSIDGGAFGNVNGGTPAVEIGSGAYYTPLLAGDTNGTEIIYRFSSPGAADTFVTVVTQA